MHMWRTSALQYTENEILFLDPAPVHFESMRYTSYSPKTEGGGYIHPILDTLLF